MLIERSLNREDVVTPETWANIAALKIDARDEWLRIARETGGIQGETQTEAPGTYEARIIAAIKLDVDLQDQLPVATEYYCETVKDSWSTRTAVFNMESGQGVGREIFLPQEEEETPRATERYALSPLNWATYGRRVLEELFNPDTHPELSSYRPRLVSKLFDPVDLPVRQITTEELQISGARAKLSDFILNCGHLVQLVTIYDEVAYPNGNDQKLSDESIQEIFEYIKRGKISDRLRSGTELFVGSKHELIPWPGQDTLSARLGLNYDINIGTISLYFRDDITMMLEYARLARQYFQSQGIALEA